MKKLWLCMAILMLYANFASAQADKPIPDLHVPLVIVPAKTPKPALKYTLLPDYNEMTSGDALGSYLKSFAEQSNLYFSAAGEKEFEKYETAKLTELPEAAATFGGKSLTNADSAARMDHIDWLSVTHLKRDGIQTLLPEVQQMRRLARALKIRARGQINQKKYPEAIETIKTMLGMARHMDQHPTVIGNLVGAAMALVAVQPLEEFTTEPNTPNLFWAYAWLPKPLIDFHRGIDSERYTLNYEFGNLMDPDLVWNEELIEKANTKLKVLLPLISDENFKKSEKVPATLNWISERWKDEKFLEGCKSRLIELGLDPKKVAKYPKEQLVFVDQIKKFEIYRDDQIKYAKLPSAQFVKLWSQPKGMKEGEDLLTQAFIGSYGILSPYRNAQLRVAQRFALLQVIEGLREYAALHEGKLPSALSEVDLPLPNDPITDKPFNYELKEGKATLKGTKFNERFQLVIYELEVKH